MFKESSDISHVVKHIVLEIRRDNIHFRKKNKIKG